MIWDDEALSNKGKQKLKDLSVLSQEELKDYILALKEEIQRVEAEIEKKKSVYSVAEGFFKK